MWTALDVVLYPLKAKSHFDWLCNKACHRTPPILFCCLKKCVFSQKDNHREITKEITIIPDSGDKE